MSAEVAKVLRDAADLIEPPGRWTKGDLARDAAGVPVGIRHDNAVSWCMVGAVAKCAPEFLVEAAAWGYVESVVRLPLGNFNDTQPSVEPVVAALRAAADEAEKENER